MSKKEKVKYKRATLDIETDPFLYNRTPHPFCIGFFDGENYVDFWGDDCIAEMIEFLESLEEPHRIYVHNGGGFDFWYIQDWITNPLFFINRKIAKCGFLGKHELRDSYRMIPVPLSAYAKEGIDYMLFEEHVREKHKKKILHYLMMDCKHLYNMIDDFIERYGEHLTIGSAAIKQLRKLHPNNHETQHYDALFRPYYLGGRNQCFAGGRVKGKFKIYDVNSSYPKAMRDMLHPLGNQYRITNKLPESGMPYFAKIIADSKGALPIRTKTGLDFPHGENEFFACSHEIQMALDLSLIKIKKVIECREWKEAQRFDKYVDKFVEEKIRCENEGDIGGRLFAKLFLNSSYGKFGQDPLKYKDCEIFESVDDAEENGYTICQSFGDRMIGMKQADIRAYSFNNVAVAASITSGSRAILLEGLSRAENPIYCDTDSIICESLDMDLHDTKLGAWKNEATCDEIYIAGKKMYAAFLNGKCVKKASKGVQADSDTIVKASMGLAINVPIDAPNLRPGSEAKFIQRNIRGTLDSAKPPMV